MNNQQMDTFNKVIAVGKDFIQYNFQYWKEYSYIDTWQFWLTVALVIGPLVLLFINIDHKNILLLGFYGCNIHIWFGYVDTAFTYLGFINYPYFLIPFFPSFTFEASLIPVFAMLTYQWTLKYNKNFYLYTFILAALFAFIFEPVAQAIHLTRYAESMNYFYVFLTYIVVFLFSKMITNIFLYLQNKVRKT